MNPWKVSAQFAAFVWFSERNAEKPMTPAEAARFAEDNWVAFLPCAHEGYGRLLIRIAKLRPPQTNDLVGSVESVEQNSSRGKERRRQKVT